MQGIGYTGPNLPHFRSIKISNTASKSDESLNEGWLARTFVAKPAPREFAADGVVVGSNDMGPLAGQGTRNATLKHMRTVERDIVQAAGKLNAGYIFKAEFPGKPFGNAVKTAAQLVASNAGIAVIRLTLNGFDTHANQLVTQANLLRDLGDGLEVLKASLLELNRWNSTLVMTYAEFDRRPQENQSGGTDHGTANVHFLAGGRVKGGLYGQSPQLDRLDGAGNLPFAIDFRSLYATALERWWG